ncbi:MAG: APC family permease [Bryobacteraceae bacterium]
MSSFTAGAPKASNVSGPGLRRSLTLWDLVFYGIVVIQPTAPMPLFGVVSQEAKGHVVTTVLIAMCAMLLTAISYGRMARAYPSAGSAYTYVGREFNPGLGFLTGWSVALDYMINPVICTIWCSKAMGNIAPEVPYAVWAVFFALLYTGLNLRGIRASARTSQALVIAMSLVVVAFLAIAARYIFSLPAVDWTRPFYNPETFSVGTISTGASIAVLTYIGFDGISTLSEEVENPRRNILLATVLTCLITGVLATVQVYAGQLVWPEFSSYPDVDTAFVHVAGRAGGPVLFQVVNFTLLVATIGSGMGAHLAAARLLYGMGRDKVLPYSFFAAIDPRTGVPRNNVIFVGCLVLVGAFAMTYQLGAELLNFGAFIAFMGVNASAFVHYYLRANEKKWINFLPPILGFLICFYIWSSLRTPAKLAGGAWLATGLAYYAWKTHGFRKQVTLSNHE